MKPIYLILGMGQSGRAVYDFLTQKNYEVFAFDDTSPHYKSYKIINHFEDVPWHKINILIQSPGIPFEFPKPHPITHKAQTLGIPILSDLDLFETYKPSNALCIGITGTNGKSTTTALITHLLNYCLIQQKSITKAVMAGNIGISPLEFLTSQDEVHPSESIGFYVLELSSYQLEILSKLTLEVAIFLNLTPDHLERHGSLERYKSTKEKIFHHAKYCIKGDEESHKLLSLEDMMRLSPLKGVHNLQNVNCAIQSVLALGFKKEMILEGLASFQGLAHRLETVYEDKKLLIINDSKATNAEAAECALKAFINLQEPNTNNQYEVHWIAGGRAKEGGISYLAPYFSHMTGIYLIGEAMEEFNCQIKSLNITSLEAHCRMHPTLYSCSTLDNAIEKFFEDLKTKPLSQQKKKILLFSPACASLDQFRNFEHRGDVFKKLIKNMLIPFSV